MKKIIIGGAALGAIFSALKLTNVISWSWWWVLSPIYGTLIWVIISLIVIILALKKMS